LYVDGISLDSATFDEVVALGVERIVVLAIGCDLEAPGTSCWRRPVPVGPATAPTLGAKASPAAVVERWTRVWRRAELDQIVRRLPAGIETHVIPLTTGTDGGVLDFTRVPCWIERGYALTRAYLDRAMAGRSAISDLVDFMPFTSFANPLSA
jgi:hypothetical protein